MSSTTEKNMDTMVFATKFKKIFSVDRKNKIDSQDLKEMATSYQLKYDGMTDQELILNFSKDFRKYLEFSLEDEGCWHNPKNPQHFLISLAKVGTLSYPIFRGYIPQNKVKLLRPYIEKMIVKIFQFKNFQGFDLVFKHCHKITSSSSITLSWGDFTIDELNRRRQSRLERKRDRETSRSHNLNLEISPLLSDNAAKSISVPIYNPDLLSQEKMIKEIKRDVRKNISKLRSDIKKNIIAETKTNDQAKEIKEVSQKRASVLLTPMKVETEINHDFPTPVKLIKKSSDDEMISQDDGKVIKIENKTGKELEEAS